MQSKDDKIFYFSKKQVQQSNEEKKKTDGDLNPTEQLELCILDFDQNRSGEFDCEIGKQTFVIDPESQLYKLMLPGGQQVDVDAEEE